MVFGSSVDGTTIFPSTAIPPLKFLVILDTSLSRFLSFVYLFIEHLFLSSPLTASGGHPGAAPPPSRHSRCGSSGLLLQLSYFWDCPASVFHFSINWAALRAVHQADGGGSGGAAGPLFRATTDDRRTEPGLSDSRRRRSPGAPLGPWSLAFGPPLPGPHSSDIICIPPAALAADDTPGGQPSAFSAWVAPRLAVCCIAALRPGYGSHARTICRARDDGSRTSPGGLQKTSPQAGGAAWGLGASLH